MPEFTPVEHDPFDVKMTPVDHDPFEGTEKKPARGVVDKLLGLTGPRFQTFPERAVRETLGLPQKLIEAAQSAPPGSRELSARLAGPALETAMVATPLSPAVRGARLASGGPAPTETEIGGASTGQYKQVREMNVPFAQDSINKLADDWEKAIYKEGYRDYNTNVYKAIKELRDTKNPTYTDIEAIWQLLTATGAKPEEKDAVRRSKDILRNFLENLSEAEVAHTTPFGHFPTGNAELASQLSKSARGNWSSKKGVERIQKALDDAELAAGSAHSGANIDNAIRQQIKAILKDPKQAQWFRPEELEQMRLISIGTPAGNTLRTGGNVLGGGGGIGSTLMAAGGALAAGPMGVAAPVAGYALKQAGGASTRRQVELLIEMIKRRSPLAEERGLTEPQVRALTPAERLAAPGRASGVLLNTFRPSAGALADGMAPE